MSASKYPQPKAQVARISVQDLHDKRANKSLQSGKDFVVVDVRRTDIDVSRLLCSHGICEFIDITWGNRRRKALS